MSDPLLLHGGGGGGGEEPVARRQQTQKKSRPQQQRPRQAGGTAEPGKKRQQQQRDKAKGGGRAGGRGRAGGGGGRGRGRQPTNDEAMLCSMGFDRDAARAALAQTHDVASAVELLSAEGSRKGRDANHLLRFTSAPRVEAPPPPRRVQQRRRRGVSFGAYEQPTIRLLVDNAESPWSVDADIAVDWDSVIAVDAPGEKKCPICLCADARAPVVAGKCGHVFCAACLVRHAGMVETQRSRRCPCCNGALLIQDVRPARWWAATPIAVGKPLTLVLCERYRDARAASTVFEEQEADEPPRLPTTASMCSVHSKITLAGEGAVQNAQEAFLAALKIAEDEAEDSVERRDVLIAKEAIERLVFKCKGAGEGSPRKKKQVSKKTTTEGAKKRYLYYAAADGQQAYLHPLLLKTVLAAVDGDPNQLPKTLTLRRVSYLERFVQTEESRKRFPWLSHLQLHSDVHLADVDLADLDGDWPSRLQAALGKEAQLASALRERRSRLARDAKLAQRAERRDDARHRADERRRQRDRPTFELHRADFISLTPQLEEEVMEDEEHEEEEEEDPTVPSFASLVSKGFAAEFGCPALCENSPPKHPTALPAAWNRSPPSAAAAAAAAAASPAQPPPLSLSAMMTKKKQEETQDVDTEAPPPAPLSLGGALHAALTETDDPSPAPSSKVKKGRARPISLTGGGRRY